MRSLPSGPKSALVLLSSMVVLSGAMIVGCSGTPSPDDPNVKKGVQATREAAQKQDLDAKAAMNKRGKSAQIKSIKSKIGAGD
jgi:PBP1b-binding outer membrane lipoprotein LpoB